MFLGVVSGAGAGVLKSTNDGLTWELLGNSVFEGANIGSIAVHPTQKKILYVSVWSGGPGGGVYQSTDSGLNWTNLTPFHSGAASDVIIARYNPDVLYAGLVSTDGQATNGVYRSGDGGQNWRGVGLESGFFLGGAVRLESGSSPGRVYVSLFGFGTRQGSNDPVFGIYRYRTHNDGKRWHQLGATPGSFENRSWHVVLAVDPKDDDHIIANDEYALFESTDAGRHWTAAETMGDDYANATFDAENHLVVTADRSVYRRTKKSKKWSVQVGDLAVTLSYDLALDPNNPEVLYGVAQDHPSAMKLDTFNPWQYMPAGGETGKVLVDPTNSKRLYISSPQNTERFVQRSSDGGKHWKTILTITAFGDDDYGLAYATQKSFVMDITGFPRSMGTTRGVFHSVNNGGEWKTFGAGLPNIIVTDLKMLQAKHVLAAATFGRGAWEILIGPSTISGNVFEDRDGDGVQDASDSGIEGVTVFLDANGNDKLDRFEFRTTTGGHGHYLFDEVPPSIYAVRQVVPYGYVQTTKNPRSLTVGGSQVQGRDFGNQAVETRGPRARFVHPTELHWLPGRQPGQPIGAQAEFSSLARSGKKRKATQSSGRKARRPKR